MATVNKTPFQIGDRVKIKPGVLKVFDGKIAVDDGKILKLFNDVSLAFVEFDNGETGKVSYNTLEFADIRETKEIGKPQVVSLTIDDYEDLHDKLTSIRYLKTKVIPEYTGEDPEEISDEEAVDLASAALVILDALGDLIFSDNKE